MVVFSFELFDGSCEGIEVAVSGCDDSALGIKIHTSAENPVNEATNRDSHEEGDVNATECQGNWPLVEGQIHEWNHDDERQEVGGDSAPVPVAVNTDAREHLANRVVTTTHEKKVRQVNRGPRCHQVRQDDEDGREARVEEVRGHVRAGNGRRQSDQENGHDADSARWYHRSDAV